MSRSSPKPNGDFHHSTSWLPGMTMTLLTFSACLMNTRARWNSPARARCERSPEIATTSKRRSARSASIASNCSGTAGRPKWRSEQWKIVGMRRASEARDDGVREGVGGAGAAEVGRGRLPVRHDGAERGADAVGALPLPDVVEHEAGREQEG